ncbi:MAG: rhodanese-like domain-containing protein [Pseudomonadota bacterium]
MITGTGPRIYSVSPVDAWDLLKQEKGSVLVDVRTQAEWTFVGVPDTSSLGRAAVFVEWQHWPSMSPNARFVEDLDAELAGRQATALLFLCRSGVRSMAAAQAVEAAYATKGVDVGCINVSAGFEGDLDARAQRGSQGGWKKEGLPWRQA